MATIYNSDLSKELREGGKLAAKDQIPTQLADKVVPVMEVNPKILRRINFNTKSTSTATGTLVAYTVPTGKKFFLTNLTFSISKDVACDATEFAILIANRFSSTQLVDLFRQTLTAESVTVVESYQYPIEMNAGETISIYGPFTVGTCSKALTVQGYLVENINA